MRGAGSLANGEMLNPEAMKDVGMRALDLIHERLMIDEDWTSRGERHFEWFAYRLSQVVSASPVVDREGRKLSLINATTLVVDDIQTDCAQVEHFIALMNSDALGSGFIFDAEMRCLSFSLAHQVHDETIGFRSDQVAAFAILQICEAEQTASFLAETFRGRVAERAHPTNGMRVLPDEMLGIERAFAEAGADQSLFQSSHEMQSVYRYLRDSPHASMGASSTDICIEVACGESYTTLIELSADHPHPRLGAGLSVRTTLPWDGNDDELTKLAIRLQTSQFHTVDGGGQFGAWCVGRHRERPHVIWTRFIPNWLFRPGLALDAAIGEVNRAIWVDGLLCPGLPPRTAWAAIEKRNRLRLEQAVGDQYS